MYTVRIEKAIKKAGILHAGQDRKGVTNLPYLTHLISVMLIAGRYTDDENTLIAALLHDTIEDTSYTAEELMKDFGSTVQKIVLGVTEPPREEMEWEARKRTYIKGLKTASKESLLVAAADKVHNLRTIIHEYANDKERFWEEFSGTPESRTAFYGEMTKIIVERLDNPIVPVLQNAYNEYRGFLQSQLSNTKC